MCRSSETPIERMDAALGDMQGWMTAQPASAMGDVVIKSQQLVNRIQAFSFEATRRVEKSGAYKEDGAPGMVSWLRDKARLSGADAAEHVSTARHLEQLPRTEEALARGEIGYAHAVAIARTAEHVGTTAVRKAEASLLQSAESMDAGQFVAVVKDFEHKVDAEASLAEANRAHQRRYLSISEPVNGLSHIEGQLVAEAAATIRSAMEPYMKPSKNDDRTSGQRAHDALEQVCRRSGAAGGESTGLPPQLIITTTVDTLAGISGAPAGQLQGGGTIPSETVRRMACEAAITRITGRGELDREVTHASRTIPPATRRALVARDKQCVFPGCDRRPSWCQGHHLKHWANDGPTTLPNLALVCVAHHRKVHEEDWQLERRDGRWLATPPWRKAVAARRE